MSNAYENLTEDDKKNLMKNYKPPDKKKRYFINMYRVWQRLTSDKRNKTDDEIRWLADKTGFLWAVERGAIVEGEATRFLDPDDAQAQEILASGAPASTPAVNRGNSSQRRRKSKKTGKEIDTTSNRNDEGQFQRPGGYVRPTPTYENQPRYKGRFITPEQLEKLGQLSVNQTLPRSDERDEQNAEIERNFDTPRTQPQRRGGMDEQEFNQLANRLATLKAKLEKLKIPEGSGSSSGNTPDEIRANKLRKEIQQIQQQLLARGRKSDLTPVNEGGNDIDGGGGFNNDDDDSGGGFDNDSRGNDGDFNNEGGSYNTAPAEQGINQQILFRNNFVQPVQVDGILRKPVQLSTIISWMKKWAEWRFCDGLNRLYENIKQRPRSEFSQIKSMIHKLTISLVQNMPFLNNAGDNIRYAKMFPSIAFFSDPQLLNLNPIEYGEQTFELPPALLKFSPTQEYYNFRFGTIRRPLIGQASALTDTHVIRIDNQVGLQLRYGDSGVENGVFNVANEKYKIPQRKMFEICCLMHMYKRQKARYISIFDPTVVLDMVISILDRGCEQGVIVYKPWFNYEMDSVKTLLDMPKREIVHAIYEACWNLELNENRVESNGAQITDGMTLISYHREGDEREPKRKRYRPAALGATRGDNRRVRRLIYEDAIRQMKNRYTTLVREWGNVGSNDGQVVLDEWGLRRGDVSIRGTRDDTEQAALMEENENNQDEIARPLFELERIDVVFSEPEIQRLVDGLQQDINRGNGVAATNGVNLPLQTGILAQNIYTALFTKKLRGMKRGRISRVYGDGRYEVTWHIPTDVLDGRNNLNHTTVLTRDQIIINHRRVSAFLLSQISRWKEPFKFSEELMVDLLRVGNALPFGTQEFATLFNTCTEPYSIAIDINGTASTNGRTVYREMRYYIERFQAAMELKNEDRPCNGKYQDPRFERDGTYIQIPGQPELNIAEQPIQGLSISKEIDRILNNMENSLFQVDPNRAGRCVQRNCTFVGGQAWKIEDAEE